MVGVESEVVLRPVGVIHVDVSDDVVRNSLEGVDGVVEIFPEFEEGLDGIEGFSHLIILAYLHKVREEQRKTLKVRFRKWGRLGVKVDDLPEVGVFCTDSPHRPNPIALTIVKLVEREGRFLKVSGLDLFNGTPVLDIKPYDSERRIEEFQVPHWRRELEERVGRLRRASR